MTKQTIKSVMRHVATLSKISLDAIDRETKQIFRDLVTEDEQKLPMDQLVKIRRSR